MSTPLKKVADPEELQRHTYALKALFAKECSDENDSVSCHRLAEFFQSVEKDFPAAVAQYKYVIAAVSCNHSGPIPLSLHVSCACTRA
jgi:hypothetical protein